MKIYLSASEPLINALDRIEKNVNLVLHQARSLASRTGDADFEELATEYHELHDLHLEVDSDIHEVLELLFTHIDGAPELSVQTGEA